MTAAFAIRTVLELIAIVLIAYGILNERKLIAFEDKLIRIIAKKIYLRRRRKAIAARRAQGKHLRAVPDSNRVRRCVRSGRVA
jgi:hypothetical protein